MTDKELKKLSRRELLELLLEQTKRADELQRLLDEANQKLESRDIELNKAGSIAEAALKLNGIFQAAEAAAEQYVESVKKAAEVRPEKEKTDSEKKADTPIASEKTKKEEIVVESSLKKKKRPLSYEELIKKLSEGGE